MLTPGSTGVEPTIPRTSRVPSKPHRFRSLTGCLTCRQRKKKCDENRPICVACLRNKLQCTWPADNPRRIAQNSEPQVAAQDLTNFPVQHDPSAQWSMTTGSFLSPTKVFRLTETSSLLFTHYVVETANVLSTSQSGSNPFLTFLVPLCRNDDLLMHSLLTLSGAHLRSTNPGIEVYLATYRHYSIVIRTIRDCISNHATMDMHQALRVLLTLMILSFFETLSGDDQGAMFSHLRASRQIIIRLAKSPLPSSFDDNARLFSFVLEIYRFLTLSNNIIPHGSMTCRTLPQDTFLDGIYGSMSHFDTHGIIFGDSQGIFEILPDIAVLTARRLTERSPSHASLEMHHALHSRITEWKPPESTVLDQAWQSQRKAALELCREAALLYLETAMTPDASSDIPALAKIQKHVDKIMLYAEQAAGSPYETILLGPLIIAGSCMLQTDQRQLLQASLRSNRFHMHQCVRAASLLEYVWNDPSGRLFGPYGLAVMMRRRGINLAIA